MEKLNESALQGLPGTIVAVAIVMAIYKYKIARLKQEA